MKIQKLGELYVSFFKIGGLTFGGGLAMLPMLQREIVTARNWCTEEEILDMYAIGQCTPGIIAVNTATYVGYKQAGFWGGLFATLGVCALMLNTVVTMAKKGIVDKLGGFLFAGGFILACFSPIPTAVIIVLSGIIGVIAKRTGGSKNS